MKPEKGRMAVAARDGYELDFLPAALEIVQAPPSPLGRAIGYTIVLFFCVAIGWASLSRIDVVSSAPGRIVPTGQSKVVQPFETGVIRSIDVREGQRVKTGDRLIVLDPTISRAEVEHIRSDLLAAQLDVARLKAAAMGTDDPRGAFAPPVGATEAMIAVQSELLQQQVDEERGKLEALDRQKAQKQAEADTIGASINKIEAIIPVVQERLDIRKALLKSEYGSRVQYLEMLQMLVDQQQELLVQKSHQREAQAAVSALVATREQTAAEYRRKLYADLAEAERKAAGLSSDLVKAEQKTKLQELTAPVDGIVQELSVHTVGGVVTPAQRLLVVVPSESQLVAEVMVSNSDIGFVRPGQDAQIKVATFNFVRYGMLHGTVLTVSSDAVLPQGGNSPQNGQIRDDPQKVDDARAQQPRYLARLSLDKSAMQINGEEIGLAPGMAVTADIKTDSRTLMSYILSPLLEARNESFRER